MKNSNTYLAKIVIGNSDYTREQMENGEADIL